MNRRFFKKNLYIHLYNPYIILGFVCSRVIFKVELPIATKTIRS